MVGNPQVLGEEVPTFIAGELPRIGNDNEQQWATQHVTIIHQSSVEGEGLSQADKSIPRLSWDMQNGDTVPLILTSQNSVGQEVSRNLMQLEP